MIAFTVYGYPHYWPPDRDKLLRAVQDALCGLYYEDDGQVASGPTEKVWCGREGRPGARIRIWPWTETPAGRQAQKRIAERKAMRPQQLEIRDG